MTRILLVAAVAAALAAPVRAGNPAPVVPAGDVGPSNVPAHLLPAPVPTQEEVVNQRYGLLPWLRGGWSGRGSYGACSTCDKAAKQSRLRSLFHGHGGHGDGGGSAGYPGEGVPGVPQPGQPGMGMPGTLVFPTNPYIRSPRDFFMTPPGR